MVTSFKSQAPRSVRDTSAWLLRVGRPPLPECPIEAAKHGKDPKQPCYFDGRRVIPISWKQWQNTQPIPEIINAWFLNPKTGIGTLGGWNGKHWLGWIDFDQKDFSSPDECDRAIDQWVDQYPVLAKAPMFRTPSGGYRFLVGFSQEPQNFKANSGFSLNPNGSHHVGELLAKNGGHTLLPPTIGANGKPYYWVRWSEYPPVVEQPEDVGLYPVLKRTGNNLTAIPSAKQGNFSTNTDTGLREFLECDIYSRLTAEVAFCWSGHDFKPFGSKLKGNCPWHDSQSGTAFYIDRKNDQFLWRCPACEIGGSVIEYRHRLAGGNGSPRGKDFVDIVRQLADDVGVSMPTYKSHEVGDRAELTSKGSSNNSNPPVSSVSLRDRVLEILNRNHSVSERKTAFIELARSNGRQVREIEQLAEALEFEVNLTEERTERTSELNQLLKIGNRRLTLSRYLHSHLAQPLERLAVWMGVDAEALLTVLLPTSASLLHPETRVIVKECIDFVEPLVFYTGIISESGNRKSPIFKTITKPLRKFQDEEDICYEEAYKQYQQELKSRKHSKSSEEKGEPPEPPEPPREYFVDNITSEALDRIKAQQTEHGILIRKDELSGLFGSYGAYKNGRGSDKEGILSGWNGDGIKVNRVSGSRLSLSHDARSIVGAIQPGKLRKIMGDLEDEQGEWARFLWYNAPLRAIELPELDSRFEVGKLLEDIYRKLDKLTPVQYRFTPDAQRVYQDWHRQLEQRKLKEPRQGMRAAIAKMQGYTARIASILHILWDTAAGQIPEPLIPVERLKAAKALAEFYLGQVRLIYSDGEASYGELTPILAKILEKARQQNQLTTRTAKSSIKALRNFKTDKILECFRELAAMGHATVEGKTLIPQIADRVDQVLTKMLTLHKLDKTTDDTQLQPLTDKNVDHADRIDHFSEQVSRAEVVEQETLNNGQQSQQVNILDETLTQSLVDCADQRSTSGSKRSTIYKSQLQAEIEQVAELRGRQAELQQPAEAITSEPASIHTELAAIGKAFNEGDLVRWDDCPGHCADFNPFTITRIEDGAAWLDLYSKPVPLSKLRRCKTS